MLRIYDTLRSGNAWKVRLLAGMLDVPLQRVTLSIDEGDLQTADFGRINPRRQVPVLELDDGRHISESFAILAYLAHGTPFLPVGRYELATVLSWLSFEQATHMPPLSSARLHLALRKDRSEDEAEVQAWQRAGHQALQTLEQHLSEQQSRDLVWLSGTCPTIADVALYPYTRLAPMGGVMLDDYPCIGRWLAGVEAIPGYSPLTY